MSTNEEVTKDTTHVNLFPSIDKYEKMILNEEEKVRIAILLRKEMSEVERTRYGHVMIVTNNKDKPKLEKEEDQAMRDRIIDQHEKIVEMFDKDIEKLENIYKKLE